MVSRFVADMGSPGLLQGDKKGVSTVKKQLEPDLFKIN